MANPDQPTPAGPPSPQPPPGWAAPGWGAQPPQHGQQHPQTAQDGKYPQPAPYAPTGPYQQSPYQQPPYQQSPYQQSPYQPSPYQQTGQQPSQQPGGRSVAGVLSWLAIGAAVVALAGSFLPFVRSVYDPDSGTGYEASGWREHYSGDFGLDPRFLLTGLVLALACGVLVAGALLVLRSRSRVLGLGLQVAGAGMVTAYALTVLAQVLMTLDGGQDSTIGAGLYLVVLAAIGCVVVLVLGLRELVAATRR